MNKKKILPIAGIVVIVLLIGGGVLLWAVWQSAPKNDESKVNSNSSVRQYSDHQQLIDDVNKKYGVEDYKGAIELIKAQRNVNDPEMQLLLAGAYANAKDYKKSLEIYKKLDDEKKLPESSLEGMAYAATETKEYRLAIDLYKRTKAYAISLNDGNTDQIETYDYQIAELEKKL